MNKRHLHHIWRYLRSIHPWYFAALTVIFGIISLVSVRHNYEGMVVLRDAVYTTDQKGGDVETALRNLRKYVYGHMNTSLATGPNAVHPPIQLKYTYERLQEAEQKKLSETNTKLYNDAQAYCQAQNSTDFSGRNRVPCVEEYVTSHGATLTPIPDGLYKFDFTSAKWSPDLAGWSIVITVLSFALLLITGLYRWWAKKFL